MEKFTKQKDLGNQEFKNSTGIYYNNNRKLPKSLVNIHFHSSINRKNRVKGIPNSNNLTGQTLCYFTH